MHAQLKFGAAFTAAWTVLQWLFVLIFVFIAFVLIYFFKARGDTRDERNPVRCFQQLKSKIPVSNGDLNYS